MKQLNLLKKIYTLLAMSLLVGGTSLGAQEAPAEPEAPAPAPSAAKVEHTFHATRVINSHSVETLKKRFLDFRISHRFGDVSGGWSTLIGFENAADVNFTFDYGITDKLTIGVSRNKGVGELRALVSGSAKYRILEQTEDNKMPISLTVFGQGTMSTMKKNTDTAQVTLSSFEKTAHRLIYTAQILVARKFSKHLTLQAGVAYLHRNIVNYDDVNDLIVPQMQARVGINKKYAIILDAFFPINSKRTIGKNGWQMPLGIGFETVTGGGHVFQINLTNSDGLSEIDFIPATQKSWLDGGFRLGFTISRLFYFREKQVDEDF